MTWEELTSQEKTAVRHLAKGEVQEVPWRQIRRLRELGLSDTSARIIWSSIGVTNSRLHYGTQGDKLDQVADEPWAGSIYSVWLKNLAPNTTYYYRLGGAAAPGSAAEGIASFRTRPSGVEGRRREQPVTPLQ